MREVEQTGLAPNGFRDIDDDIARVVPGREDTYLGLALRIDRAIEKTDARVAAAGIWENRWRLVRSRRPCILRDAKSLFRVFDFARAQTGGGADFLGGET